MKKEVDKRLSDVKCKEHDNNFKTQISSQNYGVQIRTFESGATRDTDEGKNDYEGILSPLVIEAYGDYMKRHSVQSNGERRSSDNWQKGFGCNHFTVCMKSLWRHFLDMWKIHRGYKARGTIDDAICGLIFNAMAYYHQLLVDRLKNEIL